MENIAFSPENAEKSDLSDKFDSKPQINMKFLLKNEKKTEKKLGVPTIIELSERSMPKILKSLVGLKENSVISSENAINYLNLPEIQENYEKNEKEGKNRKNSKNEKNLQNEKNRKNSNFDENSKNCENSKKSENSKNRENCENEIFSHKSDNSEDIREENRLLKSLLKLKQKEIESLYAELSAFKNQVKNMNKHQNFHEIKEIKQFETKQNDDYFKEKELNGQFTHSTDNKEKFRLNLKEITENFFIKKHTIFPHQFFNAKFLMKNKQKISKFGMISCVEISIDSKSGKNYEISMSSSIKSEFF